MALEFGTQPRHHKRKRETPLEYMLRIMNDDSVPDDRRDRMAGCAAPYVHPKIIQATRGKKAEQTEAATMAGVGTSWGKDLSEIRTQ